MRLRGALLVVLLMLAGPAPVIASPAEAHAPHSPYADLFPFGGRILDDRVSKPVRLQIEEALRWIVAHQVPDGSWSPTEYHLWCDGEPTEPGERASGQGKVYYAVGTTALGALALLAVGHTHEGSGPEGKALARALRWLISQQDDDGCFGARASQQYVYNHAFAALALVEAFGMTGDEALLEPAQRGLDFVALCRNPYFAWRYGIKPGDNDTSVTVNMTAALYAGRAVNQAAVKHGKRAPFTLDEGAWDGAKFWTDKMIDPDYGLGGYVSRGSGPARPNGQEGFDRWPSDKTRSMTAACAWLRIACAEDPRKSKLAKMAAEQCAKVPPTWDPNAGACDMYYWHWGSRAMHQIGGKHGESWRTALETAAAAGQVRSGRVCGERGSWPPVGPWGSDGGRIYSTAMMTLALAEPVRSARIFGSSPALSSVMQTAVSNTKLHPALRARLVRGLPSRADGNADGLVARALEDESVAVRRAAAYAALRLKKGGIARTALVTREGDADALVALLAGRATGVAASRDAALRKALGAADMDTRLAALDEIARDGTVGAAVIDRLAAMKPIGGLTFELALVQARATAQPDKIDPKWADLVRRGLEKKTYGARPRALALAGRLLPAVPELGSTLINVVLESTNEPSRMVAASALASGSKADPLIAAGIAVAAVDKDHRVAAAGCASQATLGASAATTLDGLAKLLGSLEARMKKAKEKGPIRLARWRVLRGYQSLGPDAVPLLVPILDAGSHASGGAIGALSKLGAAAVPALLEALRHENARRRAGAARALADSTPPQPGVVPALVTATGDTDKQVRATAADALLKLGWEALPSDGLPAEATWIAALADAEATKRRQALLALIIGGTQDEAALPAVADRLADENKTIRELAYDGLARTMPASKAAITATLEHPSRDARVAAMRLVARFAAEHTFKGTDKTLGKALSDPELFLVAVKGLGAMGKAGARQLAKAYPRHATAEQSKMLDALKGMGEKASPAANAIVKWLKLTTIDTLADRRRAQKGFDVLVRIGKSAASKLHPLLRHPDSEMRAMVADTLGWIGYSASKNPLKAAIKKEPNKSARDAMKKALEKIGR